MDLVQNIINQSQGRDRVLRATQYACALSVYALRNNHQRKELVIKLKSLEANMSAGRKLFRLGNALNAIEAARRSARLPDRALGLCLTLAHVGRALYLTCDNALWAAAVGLLPDLRRERWSVLAWRFYLASLAAALARDLYVLARLMARRARDGRFRRKMISHLNESPDVAEAVVPHLDAFVFLLLHSFKSEPAVLLDAVKNVCDLAIPLDKLGAWRCNAGAVAFCGLVSSLIGIVTMVQPKLRVKP
ncbi:peroxisomal membrane protein 11A [Festucalex cinctus]